MPSSVRATRGCRTSESGRVAVAILILIAIAAYAAFALLSDRSAEGHPQLEQSELEARLRRLIPMVERAVGTELDEPIGIDADFETAFAAALEAHELAEVEPEGTDLRAEVVRTAMRTCGPAAFFDPLERSIVVDPAAFELSRWTRRFPNDELDEVLIHELVHAFQYQDPRLLELKTMLRGAEARALHAVIEGHAVFVAAEATGTTSALLPEFSADMFERLFRDMASEDEETVANAVTALWLEMAYMRAPEFVRRVAERHPEETFGHLLDRLPKSVGWISNPARYLEPPPHGIDFEGLDERLAAVLGEDCELSSHADVFSFPELVPGWDQYSPAQHLLDAFAAVDASDHDHVSTVVLVGESVNYVRARQLADAWAIDFEGEPWGDKSKLTYTKNGERVEGRAMVIDGVLFVVAHQGRLTARVMYVNADPPDYVLELPRRLFNAARGPKSEQ